MPRLATVIGPLGLITAISVVVIVDPIQLTHVVPTLLSHRRARQLDCWHL